MEIQEAQKMSYEIIEDWNIKNNKIHNKKTTFTHFVEEVGEMAKEITHFQDNWRSNPDQERLSEEMADVFIQLLILVTDYDVNLENAFINKIKKLRERYNLDD